LIDWLIAKNSLVAVDVN